RRYTRLVSDWSSDVCSSDLAGTFLISRVPTCLNASVVSRTKLISSPDNSRRPRRSFRVQRVLIPFPTKLRRVRCRFLADAPEFARPSQLANSCRRNRVESAAGDGRDPQGRRVGYAPGVQTN